MLVLSLSIWILELGISLLGCYYQLSIIQFSIVNSVSGGEDRKKTFTFDAVLGNLNLNYTWNRSSHQILCF